MKYLTAIICAALIAGGAVAATWIYVDHQPTQSRTCHVVKNVYNSGEHLECR